MSSAGSHVSRTTLYPNRLDTLTYLVHGHRSDHLGSAVHGSMANSLTGARAVREAEAGGAVGILPSTSIATNSNAQGWFALALRRKTRERS